MTSSSKTSKTRDTPLGKRNEAAARPKKSRTCGYFDCAGCAQCKHVTSGVTGTGHRTFRPSGTDGSEPQQ